VKTPYNYFVKEKQAGLAVGKKSQDINSEVGKPRKSFPKRKRSPTWPKAMPIASSGIGKWRSLKKRAGNTTKMDTSRRGWRSPRRKKS
jgi:hypothetical protein